MKNNEITSLHPDLVITHEAAIDRMGATASRSAEQNKPNFTKQIQLVRQLARTLCDKYRNCRAEDWCWHCASGQNGSALVRGTTCTECKLLTTDALIDHARRIRATKLVQITAAPAEEG